MEPTVPVFSRLLETPLLAFQNSFTKYTLYSRRVFHELLYRQLIRPGHKVEHDGHSKTDPT